MALYHNVPDGKGGRKFVDATAEAGLLKEGHFWSTSAVFADLDGDGWPDLYLCQYVSWSLKNNPECPGYRPGIKRDVCPPRTFETRQHAVYRSTGKGGFEDVTAASGIRLEADFPKARSLRPQKPQFWYCGAGLAVLAADIVNGKGRPDLYVANDETGNFLYQNDSTPGHIRLTEVAESLGATGSSKGTPTGSMGVDMADIDGSGKPSLFVTNFQHEQHALYRMVGGKIFVHSTDEAQLDNRGRTMVGWGTAFLDLDNDGWPDVVIAHGHVVRHPKNSDLLQLPGLFANNGDSQGKFRRIAGQGGDYFHETHLGRGLAVADFDNDGWADLVINHTNAAPAVLQNVFKSTNHSGNHWLGVHLIGSGYRDVTGARAVLKVGARRVTRFQKAGCSYAASQDPRLIFGIGDADKVNSLTVYWPTGTPKQETWLGLDIDRYHTLRQGSSPMATLKSEETPPQGQKQ